MPTMGRTEEGTTDIPKLEGLDEDGRDGEKEVGKEKERRASSRTFVAVARMKEKGRVGSCVGASSGHKRVSWTRN